MGRGQREEEGDFLAFLAKDSGEPGGAPFPFSGLEEAEEDGTQRTWQSHQDPPAGPPPSPAAAEPAAPPPQAQERTQALECSPASSSSSSSSKSAESKPPASDGGEPFPSCSSDRGEPDS